jgi:hypothetical protein
VKTAEVKVPSAAIVGETESSGCIGHKWHRATPFASQSRSRRFRDPAVAQEAEGVEKVENMVERGLSQQTSDQCRRSETDHRIVLSSQFPVREEINMSDNFGPFGNPFCDFSQNI